MSRFEEIFPLFQEYDMFAQTIDVLKEPNVFKAVTPYGSFVCKRSQAPLQRLLHVSDVLRQLQQRGWDGAVPYTYTKFDDPYVQVGGAAYYLTPWQSEQWADQPLAWATPALERLAELHHLTQNYRFDDPRQVEPLIDSLLQRWQYWHNQMEKAAVAANERTYQSPFDLVFLANKAFIGEMAKTATNLLIDWRERHETHAHFRLSLIHGYPHPAHVVPDRNGKGKLLNFDRAVFDTPIRDLTLFYRTYFQMAGDEAGASQLFHKYASIFPLRPEEIDLLAAFLSYPERIMRDIDIYYNGRREWSELYAVKRLEKDMDRLMRLHRWVQQAF
jgi:spore coat protein YsxE